MRTLLALLVLSALPAFADRLAVQRGLGGGATRDCYIWEESPSYNGNGSATLYVGQIGSSDKVTLMHFDVSAIDARATITEARLFLETYSTSGVEIEVNPITAAWVESEPTWGNFIANVSATTKGRFTPVAGRNMVDLTVLVKSWVATGTNLGFALRQATLTPATEFRSGDSAPESLRPLLEVTYEGYQAPPRPGLLVETSVPALAASCAVPFRYPLRAHAPQATSFSSSSAEITLDEVTGELSWTPTRADRGAHEVTVTVADGERTEKIAVEISVHCNAPLTVGCSAVDFSPALLVALALLRRRQR